LPARRWTGATCRGRPRCRLPAPPKCRHRGGRARQAAHPAREDQRTVRPRVVPSRTEASELQRAAPRQADPLRGSEELTVPICQLYDCSDRSDSDSLQRRRSRGKLTDSASTPSSPQAKDSGATLRRL
jgi:hypothetical protein